jgi:ATP adenylyltransferase
MNVDTLWAPWRLAYLKEITRKAGDAAMPDGSPQPIGSFLTEYWSHPERDQTNLVVHRNSHGIILLNRYPYANGHLLAALGEPRHAMLEYSPAQRSEFWKLVEIAMQLVHRTLNPQGVNMGINEGKAAGAGVPEHLHAHVIPRWAGDTNFITVVGGIRVIPGALEEMAAEYRKTASLIAAAS